MKKIIKIYVEHIGWIWSDSSGAIEVFSVNGEMASVNWYRKGKEEFNGKFVVTVVYE